MGNVSWDSVSGWDLVEGGETFSGEETLHSEVRMSVAWKVGLCGPEQ